ncbi:MAG: hypothetical protein KF889_18385 [Alphaproteobacteria bacterium]|nr:hypothetical protein [Alphaproteobacteria bacterium]MCW5743964.1 hypothetical protein [Alphaproteobacteria bacterium]
MKVTPVLFRCPARGMLVQWQYTPQEPAADGSVAVRIELVDCPACAGKHLFNAGTGKLHAHRVPEASGD